MHESQIFRLFQTYSPYLSYLNLGRDHILSIIPNTLKPWILFFNQLKIFITLFNLLPTKKLWIWNLNYFSFLSRRKQAFETVKLWKFILPIFYIIISIITESYYHKHCWEVLGSNILNFNAFTGGSVSIRSGSEPVVGNYWCKRIALTIWSNIMLNKHSSKTRPSILRI